MEHDRSESTPADARWLENCGILAQLAVHFQQFVLPLHIAYRAHDHGNAGAFTGFLIKHRERAFWITAAHVLDEIEKCAHSPGVVGSSAVWLDGFDAGGVEHIQIHPGALTCIRVQGEGMDVGAVHIRDFYLAPLLRNPSIRFLEEPHWSVGDKREDCSYCIAGLPFCLQKNEPVSVGPTGTRWSYHVPLVCLPVRLIADKGKHRSDDDFWGVAGGLYGKVGLDAGPPYGRVDDIVGMSGGPLLRLCKTNEENVEYRVIGVQSSRVDVAPDTIRASPFSVVIAALDKWIALSEGSSIH